MLLLSYGRDDQINTYFLNTNLQKTVWYALDFFSNRFFVPIYQRLKKVPYDSLHILIELLIRTGKLQELHITREH